ANPLLKGVPKDAVSKYDKAIEKIEKKDYKAAQMLLDEAIVAHPNFAAAYYEKGSAYLKDNDPDKALESFVKAIQIKPDYVEAKYSVGYTQYLKKNYEVAAAVFDDVLKQKAMPEAHMYNGISLLMLKNADAAEAQLKKAIAAKDGEGVALAHRYLGGIYVQKKRNAEAAAELQKYLDLAPKTPDAARIKTTIEDLKKQS
ncbi:MAG TPA: tetratricopeptide repeat protein, partial [Pyrinomonadaceae bacterium]|nr:tetratricopeptide repeat protein [Pyrinomonadaceae bacterium]